MTQEQFQIIQTQSETLPYSALRYTDYDTLSDAMIETQQDDLVILVQKKTDRHIIHWATQDTTLLLNAVSQYGQQHPDTRIQIKFVDESMIDGLTALDYQIISEFIDYWNNDLPSTILSTDIDPAISEITADEYEAASYVTKLCDNLSRGFHGDDAIFMRNWQEDTHSAISVYRSAGQIVGVCLHSLYGHDSDKGIVMWLRMLAVHPDQQHQGIGRKLMHRAIRWGLNHEAKRSFLMVDTLNPARHLYDALGYGPLGGRGEITMERKAL